MTPTPAATSRAEAKPTQINEDSMELSVYSTWTGKLLLKAKLDDLALDKKGKYITIDIDDDETAKPFFAEASPTSTKGDGGELAAKQIERLSWATKALQPIDELLTTIPSDTSRKAVQIVRQVAYEVGTVREQLEKVALDSTPHQAQDIVTKLREKVEAKLQRLKDNKENGPRAPEEVQSEEERDAWYDGSIEQTESFLALLPPNPKAATSGEGQ